jgi:hypothetical protein
MKKPTSIGEFIRICIFILMSLFVGINNTPAQVKYSAEIKFKDGIYLNYKQVLSNAPFPKTKLAGIKDFYLPKPLIDNKLDSLDINGEKRRIRCPKIFFFGFRGNLIPFYRGIQGKWIIFGQISIFSIHVDRLFRGSIPGHYKEYDPMYNLDVYRTKQDVVNKNSSDDTYLIDFSSGKVVLFNHEKLAHFLKSDLSLYQEYQNLKNPIKKEKAIDFIQRFNAKYPIFTTQK